jgi:hypothetical protein
VKRDGLEAAGFEAGLDQGEVEWGVDGVAGEGVIKLEAEVVPREEGRVGLCLGLCLVSKVQGESRCRRELRCWPGWRVAGHG